MVLKESVTGRPEGVFWEETMIGHQWREERGKSGAPSRRDTQLSKGTKVRFPKLLTGPLADL